MAVRPLFLLALPLFACGDKDDVDTGQSGDTGDTGEVSEDYDFTSALSGEPSVSYSGQVFRHLLIADMKGHLGTMTGRLDEGSWFPIEGEVAEELGFYFEFDSDVAGDLDLLFTTDPAATQQTYDDVSSGKNLVEKLAGNDAVGQHADWSQDFVGWEGATSPEGLVTDWFATIDAQAVAWSNGEVPLDPSGAPVPAVYVDAAGRDYQQLLQKFLLGAVAFSQGTDDYLDDDIEGKGLLSDHTAVEEGKPYTALEHGWDEGFGYFGASASYASWTDAEIDASDFMDVDGDGAIDLLSEVNWGHSQNAGKRDLSSQTGMDLTAEAWEGFHSGRALLARTAGTELSDAQLAELQGYRDQAVGAWEAAIAATVVHYINETLVDMSAMGTEDYAFGDHAKHWSELKGFALAFQFNPRSSLSEGDFAALHELVGDAPVLSDASEGDRAAAIESLLEARSLVGTAYGFDLADLGADDGTGGW